MWTLLALLASLQGSISSPSPVVTIEGEEVYSDTQQGISIRFAETPLGTVNFSSRLPAGWSYEIGVDGDQDGKWGMGPGNPDVSVNTSQDRKYGQASKNGAFCSQYVFSSFHNDPTSIYMSSECGELKSNGRVIMTGFDRSERSHIVLDIPADEFFGDSQSARIQACVWDTARWTCQHRLPDLLELKRTIQEQSR